MFIKKNISFYLIILFISSFLYGASKSKVTVTGKKMEMIKGGQQVVFSQGAEVRKGKNALKAKKIIQNKKDDTVEASGRVDFKTFSDNNELIQAKSEKAKYNLKNNTGKLWGGRPKVIYNMQGSTVPVYIQADNIDFDQEVQEFNAKGNVEVISSSACAYSDAAVFYQKEQKVVLTGVEQPYILYLNKGRHDKVKADKVTVLFDNRKMYLEGNVHGIIQYKED
ncbi:MAG: hypothetical protein JW871_01040 [Endomicrobiales bacterium]|nr:hypothetical protein [Endomicrobiales bacterium]